jgi:hypothetical protein
MLINIVTSAIIIKIKKKKKRELPKTSRELPKERTPKEIKPIAATETTRELPNAQMHRSRR